MRLPERAVEIRWPGDVAKLQEGLRARGYEHSDAEVQRLWEDYSERMCCARWLGVQGDSDVESLVQWCRND